MIQIDILTRSPHHGGKKEQALIKEIKKEPFAVAVFFWGEHYLPVHDIPKRISQMGDGDYIEIPPCPKVSVMSPEELEKQAFKHSGRIDITNLVDNFQDFLIKKNIIPKKIIENSNEHVFIEKGSKFTQFLGLPYEAYQVFAKETEIDGQKITVAVWPFYELKPDSLRDHLIEFAQTTSKPLKVEEILGWEKVKPAQEQLTHPEVKK